MNSLLQITGLSISYGSAPIVKDVSLSVGAGTVTALLGANGAGKTTLLRAISNMIVRTVGEIEFSGRAISKLPTDAIARMGVGHVPDGRGTFVNMTVEENLRLGAYTRNDKAAVEADLARIFGYFPRLRERLGQYAGTLSGGEQQMLAIGRALMSRPTLLLLDEPSFGLAPLVVKEIFQILEAIRRRDNVSILLVEQNASLALGLADYAYLMETGQIAREGTGKELSQDEAVRRVYLGY